MGGHRWSGGGEGVTVAESGHSHRRVTGRHGTVPMAAPGDGRSERAVWEIRGAHVYWSGGRLLFVSNKHGVRTVGVIANVGGSFFCVVKSELHK